ncbi:uncharacterized protein LOC144030713 isoform X2 [Festucalex cinctus]
MAHRLFEGKEQSASYWKFRISPSDDLIQHVLTFVEKQKGGPLLLAVDVGCGSGQGTMLLAKHFESVVGTDVSPAQLEVALQHARAPNATYRRRFLEEVHRVLKPRGCLALLNYTIDMELDYPGCCLQSLNQVCNEFYAALHPYRSPHLGANSIELYRESYNSIPYANKEWHECVWVKMPMPLRCYMGLVESFSSYQVLLREDPEKAARLSRDICQRLMTIMKVTSAETEVVVAVKYFYLLASKNGPGDV